MFGEQNSQPNINIDIRDQQQEKYQGYGSEKPESKDGLSGTLDEAVVKTIVQLFHMVETRPHHNLLEDDLRIQIACR